MLCLLSHSLSAQGSAAVSPNELGQSWGVIVIQAHRVVAGIALRMRITT